MNQLQIESLRDFAIEHLPRAQADREQINRFGGTSADFYRRLAVTAVMVRGKAGTAATERAAANVLEAVSLLFSEHEEPISKPTRISLLQRLARDAKELCTLTGEAIPWLDSLPATPEAEPEDKEPTAPAAQPAPLSIDGKFLTTREAAEALKMQPQTLLAWASKQTGPIQPRKVGRKNLWSGDEIMTLLKRKQAGSKQKK